MLTNVDDDVDDGGDVDDDDDDEDDENEDEEDDDDEEEDEEEDEDEDGAAAAAADDDDDGEDEDGDDDDGGGDDDDERKMMMLMWRRRKMMKLRRKTDPKTGKHSVCEPAQAICAWTFHKSHFGRKFAGKMPDAPDTTSIEHRALTVNYRKNPSVWPHCLGICSIFFNDVCSWHFWKPVGKEPPWTKVPKLQRPRLDYMKSLITMEEEKAEVIDSRALPLELRPFKSVFNPALGQQMQQRIWAG